jgi:hypothetical protein
MSSNLATVINLFGGPGSGKSTFRAAIFSILKLHGINCEETPEFAKDLTWEGRSKTLDNQIYIFGKQYHRMWRLQNQVDLIITDSPLLLNFIYGKYEPPTFYDMTMEYYNNFDNINYFINRIKDYNPNGRCQTKEEAIEIDNKIKLFLTEKKINFKSINGDYTGIDTVIKDILEMLNIKQTIKLTSI